MRKPTSPAGSDLAPSLPHENDREGRQPYAREVEDYQHGVAAPPEEQVGQEPNRRTARERIKKRRPAQ
jgi:hypothetical protein